MGRTLEPPRSGLSVRVGGHGGGRRDELLLRALLSDLNGWTQSRPGQLHQVDAAGVRACSASRQEATKAPILGDLDVIPIRMQGRARVFRAVRWAVVVVSTAVVFISCVWAVRSVSFGWMPSDDTDHWALAIAFAAATAAAAATATAWWALREDSLPEPTGWLEQKGKASDRGEVTQVGNHQHDRGGTAPGGTPARVAQEAEASGGGRVTQIGGTRYSGGGR
jgi:hypothetical protein